MNIKQFAKAGKISSSVRCAKRCNAVDIGFLTIDGKEDETQLNVEHSILTRKGLDELDKLFSYMAEELEANASEIYYVNIAAAADTMEELEAMGF